MKNNRDICITIIIVFNVVKFLLINAFYCKSNEQQRSPS